MDISVNYWAVLVAAVASIVVGSFWYGPIFGKKWIAYMGWTKEEMEKGKKMMTKAYVITFIGSLVTAYVLAHFLNLFDATAMYEAWQLAFWAWLGFIVTAGLGSVLWEGKPTGYFLINFFII